ncbi:DNA-processing protein DprA [Muricauda sp. 2012CJ35-5]|uniref:DNA-processing protein DprA n=1 Tax=Flagellimonas spongiicola TaxID=2942208 RepID=A0ABT0PSX2_9FLAO|nr:DNA-processing protein DprA [Allomuricauda spongiicola]MCL6274311.1 DNA-processing protein DprA [Allomuricauda spongiicola]
MTEDEILAALRLQAVPNIGDLTAKKLIAHCGSPSAVFSDKIQHLLKIDGIGKITLQGLQSPCYAEEAETEYRFITSEKIGYSYFTDSEYPEFLKHCIDGPILLFHRGNIDLKKRKIISVVGTRNISSYGMAFCESFIAEIAPMNPIIVSGFAYGVDITIQKKAMDYGLQTIGCLAHGLNQIYPKTHRRYQNKVEANGGFMTEFWSTSQPDRENFLKRNRIIAGMSEATLVIESAEKGGSLVTADLAYGYNREVFAVPGRVSDKQSKGCNDLIKSHKAQLLTSAAELVYLLGWELEAKGKTIPSQQHLFATIELDKNERLILDHLRNEGKQLLDHIARGCQLPIALVSSSLLSLELKGVVRPLPGKIFEAI